MLAKVGRYQHISVEPAQRSKGRRFSATKRALVGALTLPLLISACASNNILAKAEVDRSIVTGSVPASTPSAPQSQPFPGEIGSAQAASDETTIRNAVSSANLKVVGDKSISWANPATGSSGQISAVTEYRQDDILCRRFTTSRQSFDGVALYHGNACLDSTGAWKMIDFQTS